MNEKHTNGGRELEGNRENAWQICYDLEPVNLCITWYERWDRRAQQGKDVLSRRISNMELYRAYLSILPLLEKGHFIFSV
jgi:hypothetical protein